MDTEEMERQFDVNVAGYTITVKTARPPEHVDRITAMVNERVSALRSSGSGSAGRRGPRANSRV